jgi:hypothetical protein
VDLALAALNSAEPGPATPAEWFGLTAIVHAILGRRDEVLRLASRVRERGSGIREARSYRGSADASGHSATRQPFLGELVAKGLYPGVKNSGANVEMIENSSRATMQVEHAFKDHGGVMATVFLSRYTHQSPIHYRRSARTRGTDTAA